MFERVNLMFGLSAMKKHPELLPIVGIMGTTILGVCGYIGYMVYTKPDVRVIRSRGPPHEDVKPTEIRKLMTVYQRALPIPEVEQLKKEIGSYKA